MTTVDIPEDAVDAALDTVQALVEMRWIGSRGEARAIIEAAAPHLIAAHLEQMAARYPADVFRGTETTDGIAGTALRVVLVREAARLIEEAQ